MSEHTDMRSSQYSISPEESSNVLRALLDTSLLQIALLEAVRDEQGEIIDFRIRIVSAAMEKQTARTDLIGKMYAEEYPGIKSVGLFEVMLRVMQTGKSEGLEYFYPYEDFGKWFSSMFVKTGDSLVATNLDITQFRHNELELTERSRLIQGMAETSADILYIMNIESKKVFFANRSVAANLGYTTETIPGDPNQILDYIHKDDLPAMIAHIENMKTARPGEVREIEYRTVDVNGSIRFYIDRNTVFRYDDNNVPVEKLGIMQDVTERQKQQDEITKQHTLLKQSEDIAGTGSWEFDMESGHFQWSDGMYRLFDMEKGLPVRPTVYVDYAVEADRDLAVRIANAIVENPIAFVDTLRIDTGMSLRTIKIKSNVLSDKSGKRSKVLGVDVDVTAVIEAKEKIHTLNRQLTANNRDLESVNSELTTFNNIAANDYKETLRSLYLYLENIIKGEASMLSNSAKANIRKAQTAIQKMKLLTDDIVSYSRLPLIDQNVTTVNLNDVLAQAKNDLAPKIEENGARIENEDLPEIQGFPILVSLLFYHLLDNSIKFVPERQPPVVQVKSVMEDSKIDAAHDRYQVISFHDEGIGFEMSESENIFTIFYRLHERNLYRGSGIGLAVCKKIMALHGGYITAEGQPGDGTVIRCYFPV